MRDEMSNTFIKREAETELLWKFGSLYPSQLIATVFEENSIGERRFVEQKTFNLVQAKSEKPKPTKEEVQVHIKERIAKRKAQNEN